MNPFHLQRASALRLNNLWDKSAIVGRVESQIQLRQDPPITGTGPTRSGKYHRLWEFKASQETG